MLNNLLLALPYLFDKDNPLNIPESWNKWLWYVVIGIVALFLFIIVILFFKALRRSRERREEREREKEAAAAKKAEDKAAKEEAKRKKKEKPVKRVLTGITLDLGVVQRDFVIGDDFNCDGLLVNANYNVEPLTETIADFKIVKERVFEKAENGKLEGVHVCKPDMKKEGKKTIRVCFGQQMAMYSISVVKSVEEKPAEEPKEEPKPEVVAVAAPVEEEKAPERVLTGIILDVGIVERDFHVDDEFNCDGLLVTATYSVAPLQETLANFTLVDPALFDRAVTGEISGLYVCKPDLSKAGKLPVRVCYNQQVALYTISVKEKPVEEPKKEEEPKEETIVVAPVAEEKPAERVLTGITLDVGVVQRDFHVGDDFNCEGLLVNASFSSAPLQETLDIYSIVDGTTFDKAVNGKLSGLYVCKPDLGKAGKMAVRVCFNQQVALYTISVSEKPVEAPKKAEEPQVQQPAGPREMISLTVNADYARRDFYVGDTLTHDGLIVSAHYNREPFKEQVSGYTVVAPDMSKVGTATVVIMYQDRATSYTVTVRENPYAKQAEPQPVVAPVVEQPKAVRELLSVTLDTGVVQRDFEVGEEFNCDGLIVNANFSLAPTLESHADYNIVDAKSFDALMNQANGCFVCEPDTNTVGRKVVRVSFNKQIAIYTISVHAAKKAEVKEEAVPAAVPAPIVVETKPRELQNVTLDTGVVQREFVVGEDFNCDGLLINANFSVAPTVETYADYVIVDPVSFDQVLRSEVNGVYVCEPDMSTAGRKVVRVTMNKHIALYTIVVRASEKKPEPQPEPQPQPQPQVVVVEKEVPVEKAEPERALLYVTISTDNAKKDYVVGDNLNTDGLVVHAHFNKEPYMEQVTGYTVTAPDMSIVGKLNVGVQYQDKTVGYQITVREAPVAEAKPEPTTVVVAPAEPSQIVVEEESYEGRLRYDRSFNARVIQADDKVKYWYTDVKNALLSYQKVHGRISWKRETFKCGKAVVAKLAFRGNTLVLMLPVDPAEYSTTKYALEEVGNSPSNADTPAMMRLKSDKRIKQAIELIEEVMDKLDIEKDRKYQPEDFYVPYEGVFELIKKGLIKREIKTAADEAVFTGGEADDGDDDAYELTEVAPGVFVSPKK